MPMLSAAKLTAALQTLYGRPFNDVLYRAIHLEALYGFHQPTPYPEPRPLYSLGAPRSGARFTPRGGMPTLYMAHDPEAAFAEANAPIANVIPSRDTPATTSPPTVIVTAHVHLANLLDLTDPQIQTTLNITAEELSASWRVQQSELGGAPTQRLGQAIFDDGRFDALRYASVRLPGHFCYAIFPERLSGDASVEIFDPDFNIYQRLP